MRRAGAEGALETSRGGTKAGSRAGSEDAWRCRCGAIATARLRRRSTTGESPRPRSSTPLGWAPGHLGSYLQRLGPLLGFPPPFGGTRSALATAPRCHRSGPKPWKMCLSLQDSSHQFFFFSSFQPLAGYKVGHRGTLPRAAHLRRGAARARSPLARDSHSPPPGPWPVRRPARGAGLRQRLRPTEQARAAPPAAGTRAPAAAAAGGARALRRAVPDASTRYTTSRRAP